MKLALEHAYHWERAAPDRVWLTQPFGRGEVRDYTWRDGMAEARRMAAYLVSVALPPGSAIGLLSRNCAHWILADLAIWMAGHLSVPLYPTLTAPALRQILEHSEVRLLFVGKLDGWSAMKSGVPASLPCVALPISPLDDGQHWDALMARHEPLRGEPGRGADDLATIVYTSGTTGTPKGVMITFGAMAHAAEGGRAMFSVRQEDRVLSHLPLAHVAERLVVEMVTLVTGFRVYFAESLETFVDDLRRARPTVFVTVPRLYRKFQLGVFTRLPPHKLDRLLSIPLVGRLVRRRILRGLGLDAVRLAGVGAAPVPPDLLVWYRRLGLELLEIYGMTENFGYSHATRPGDVRPGHVGVPCPGVEQRIGEESEVQIKSPSMMRGYFKAPELTAESFTADGWLRTGDRGEIDGQGRLRLTGRVKELFKTSKGKYVAPSPIESQLTSHPLVEAACVSGAGQPQPFALIMLGTDARRRGDSGDREPLERALAEHLIAVNRTLEHHEALQFLAVVKDEWLTENGFLTPTLKIKRAVIEEAYAPLVDGWYAARRPVVWQG